MLCICFRILSGLPANPPPVGMNSCCSASHNVSKTKRKLNKSSNQSGTSSAEESSKQRDSGSKSTSSQTLKAKHSNDQNEKVVQ